MPLSGTTYQEICAGFSWQIPRRFNIAEATCDRHVGSNKPALVVESGDGSVELTFEHLQQQSSRLANALSAHGIARGDRIGILLPQCAEAIIAHLAPYRIGAMALPLCTAGGLLPRPSNDCLALASCVLVRFAARSRPVAVSS